MKQTLCFIFVHGLSGWGSYDAIYRRMPYWGMGGGDRIAHLRGKGFACYAASVAPTGSAWDRACELYAQLSGTRTDYGAAHSRTFGHPRFGKDFTGRPLIPDWGPDTRLVLLGHSFGGATVRLFAELLANGDADERAFAESFSEENKKEDGGNPGSDASGGYLSPFFAGGMEDRIHSIVTLAAPTNGTTAYDLFTDPDFDPESVRVPWWSPILARMMSMGTAPKKDGRDERDYAGYDMQIDHALELNRRISTLPNVYYYSVPCSFTRRGKDGAHRPRKGMEPLFVTRAYQIGAYTGKTAGGFELDDSWRENDGLVNTVSARCPIGEPSRPYDKENVRPGVWNILPAYHGDHMALQGGLMRRHQIRGFYEGLLKIAGQGTDHRP